MELKKKSELREGKVQPVLGGRSCKGEQFGCHVSHHRRKAGSLRTRETDPVTDQDEAKEPRHRPAPGSHCSRGPEAPFLFPHFVVQ